MEECVAICQKHHGNEKHLCQILSGHTNTLLLHVTPTKVIFHH